MALDTENQVLREWPFTFALPAWQWFGAHSEHRESRIENRESRIENQESIIVQGIIDMLIQTPERLVIIDFKTDSITAGEVRERAELYRAQLNLYARAVSAILKSPTTAKYLYFLAPAYAFEIK